MDILTQILQATLFFGSLTGYLVGASIVSERLCEKMDERAK